MELVRKNIPAGIATLIVLALVVFAFVSCNGPMAHIVKVESQAQTPTPVQGGPGGQQQITTYKVTVTVENQSHGTGQVLLTVKLVDKSDGKTVAENTQQLQLGDKETEAVDFDFDVPPGDYDTKTDLRYPPD
ncbi:MAG: hypothetical protein DLM69_03465 [Candidatus Chloroheliales bacterium]|nr:MAG: hypothetical protein DLM69_03465 [Chloroflexota bacterium]